MSFRSHLKWGLLGCLTILAASAILQAEWTSALGAGDAIYLLKTGSAGSAVAICIALIATI
jgi:hypothetical protein